MVAIAFTTIRSAVAIAFRLQTKKSLLCTWLGLVSLILPAHKIVIQTNTQTMNIDHNIIEENDASSFELNEDDRYADVCEPLYLQPRASEIPASLVFAKHTKRKELSEPLRKKPSDAKGKSKKKGTGPKRKLTKKRIRFGRDQDGQILCQYFSNPEALSEEEIRQRWLNEEIEEIQGEARVDAQDARSTMYHQHLLNLIDGCRNNDFKDTFHTSDLVHSAFIVANSEFRGLEVALYRVNLLFENDAVVASVLHQQEYDHVHLGRMVKKIASTSKRRSKCAKRLAYALAYGDAMVAHT